MDEYPRPKDRKLADLTLQDLADYKRHIARFEFVSRHQEFVYLATKVGLNSAYSQMQLMELSAAYVKGDILAPIDLKKMKDSIDHLQRQQSDNHHNNDLHHFIFVGLIVASCVFWEDVVAYYNARLREDCNEFKILMRYRNLLCHSLFKNERQMKDKRTFESHKWDFIKQSPTQAHDIAQALASINKAIVVNQQKAIRKEEENRKLKANETSE